MLLMLLPITEGIKQNWMSVIDLDFSVLTNYGLTTSVPMCKVLRFTLCLKVLWCKYMELDFNDRARSR